MKDKLFELIEKRKRLVVELNSLNSQIAILSRTITDEYKEQPSSNPIKVEELIIKEVEKPIESVQEEIKDIQLNKKTPVYRVSDHAMLRYLERHFDIPVENIRKTLLKEAKPKMKTGARKATINGVQMTFSNYCVTTIL